MGLTSEIWTYCRKIIIKVNQYLGYFANKNISCWFFEPQPEEEIMMVHNVVDKAIVEDRQIVVGTGSS